MDFKDFKKKLKINKKSIAALTKNEASTVQGGGLTDSAHTTSCTEPPLCSTAYACTFGCC